MKNSLIYCAWFTVLTISILNGQNTYEVREIFDISYLATDLKEDTLHRTNLFIPQGVENPTLLIWIGGGAWSYVNRHMETGIARKFAEAGIAVATVGHGLSSCVFRDPSRTTGVKHPAHIQDVAKAFDWLQRNADQYGFDPNDIFVGGFSSGAHLCALLACDEQYLQKYRLGFENIKGIIPVSGGYDISHYHQVFLNGDSPHLADEHVKAVFGNTEANFRDASPTSFIQNLNTPMLMFSDRQTYQYATLFENQLRNESSYTDFAVVHVHHQDHGQLWRSLAQESSIHRSLIIDFIKNH